MGIAKETDCRHQVKIKRFLLWGSGLFVLLLLVFSLIVSHPNRLDFLRGDIIPVSISPGMNARAVAGEFAAAGVVKNPGRLLYWMQRMQIDRKLSPGLYKIRSGIAWSVAHSLKEATPEVLRVAIIPGLTLADVQKKQGISGSNDALITALNDDSNFPPRLQELLPEKAADRLSLIAPDTYLLPPGEKAAKQLVQSGSKRLLELLGGYLSENLTKKELLNKAILASVVEKEAQKNQERARMAGVFQNRLNRNMPLQSCATIVYSWKQQGVSLQSLRYRHLEINSPYNTYKRLGLPPGSIGIPGVFSWKAAFEPEKTDYLFFVAQEDGSHIFSKTYQEHLAAQKKIQMKK